MTITIESIVYIGGLIVTIGTAIKLMYSANAKLKEPYDKVLEQINHHDECLKRDNERLNNLEERHKTVEEDLRQILLSVSVMLAHMETGNNTGEMKEARAELDKYLIKRK